MNYQLLGIRSHGDGELVPITPNKLLMNSTDKAWPVVKRQQFLTKKNWKIWYEQVFDHLVPFNKWKKEKPNVTVGSICQVKYDT